MAEHNSAEKPLFDNGNCGEYLKSLGISDKDWQNTTASGKVVTEDELLALQEKTLEEQSQGVAVHDEGPEDELEEVDYPDYDPTRDQDLMYNDNPSRDWLDTENPAENWPENNFEEQLDHRYDNTEYYLIDEKVDWDAIEGDPKQLFTVGNSKVAADTIIFNLQPARFCPSFENGMCKIVQSVGGEFKIACYAYQDERQYDIALQLRLRQMRFWDTHSAQEIFDKMAEFYELVKGGAQTYAITKAPKSKKAHKAAVPARHAGFKSTKLKFIRFNQSGDLKDKEDAEKMDEVARLAKKELNLSSYTYTARKDILNQHKFEYVHVQGSGFNAVTAINEPVAGGRGVKSIGKRFSAFPSLRDKKGNWMERDPKVKMYYEDIFVKMTPDGNPNPLYDKYTKVNPSGWYACPGDCNSCPACKQDKFKNIAVKIHRAFHKIAKDWHDVEPVGAKGYRVHQKFDPYKRDAEGKPLKWSKEMEAEYETRAAKLQREKDFSKLSAGQQEKLVKDELNHFYDIFSIDMGDDAFEDWKKDVKKWEKRAQERNISFTKIRKTYGVPENKDLNKLMKTRNEDINKYGTEEEKIFLEKYKVEKNDSCRKNK